jgi:hypothetical protein
MNGEIVIPKWVWITGILALLLGLGLVTSPRDRDNRPLLLLPDVKAMEDYRRSLVDWNNRFLELDGRMTRLLSDNYGGDLFSQSSEGQKIQANAIQLLQEIDQTTAPSAAIPARDLALGTGGAYLEVSRIMLAWISSPTAANLETARQALKSARGLLTELEASQWMAVSR